MSFFKLEDFDLIEGQSIKQRQQARDAANAKLQDFSCEVYGCLTTDEAEGFKVHKTYWHARKDMLKENMCGDLGVTHKALLINIEPIEKCKHKEPIILLKRPVTSETILPGKVGFSYFSKDEWVCRDCGVKLKISFEEI